MIKVHVEAHTFVSHGGFYGQEMVLKSNLEKLLLEIEALKPSVPDKVETFTTIAANIATILGLIFTARPQ